MGRTDSASRVTKAPLKQVYPGWSYRMRSTFGEAPASRSGLASSLPNLASYLVR